MSILIVDDSRHVHTQLHVFLKAGDLSDLSFAGSAAEAFDLLGISAKKQAGKAFDLILMDIKMPTIDGIEATRRIKLVESFQDVPIIMVTGDDSPESLQVAFEAGAVDYITKPIKSLELLARVRSSLKLKHETDMRKAREQELIELADALKKTNEQLEQANEKFRQMALIDGLTGVSNRRFFDEAIAREWKRLARSKQPLSLMMIDIDYFKSINDIHVFNFS